MADLGAVGTGGQDSYGGSVSVTPGPVVPMAALFVSIPVQVNMLTGAGIAAGLPITSPNDFTAPAALEGDAEIPPGFEGGVEQVNSIIGILEG